MSPGADGVDRLDRIAGLHAAGVEANADMRPADAAVHLTAALRQLDALGPGDGEGERAAADTLRGRVLVTLALAESEQGHIEEGVRLLALAESLLPVGERGAALGQRGMLLRRTGRDDLALEAYDGALAVLDESRQAEEVARVRLNRAVLHLAAVRLGSAREDLRACLALAERRGLLRLAAKARHNLGYVDYLGGDLPAALAAYTRVAQEYAVLAPGMLPVLSLDRARALLAAGLFTDADRELQQVVAQLGRQRLSQDLAEAHLERAEAALLAGRPAASRKHAARAHQLFGRRDNPRWAARSQLLVLRADQATGGARARGLAERAEALHGELVEVGLPEDARVAGLVVARALVAAGRAGDAAARLADGVPRAADRTDTRLLWRLASAEAASALGEPRNAAEHLSRGLETLQAQRNRVGALDLQTGAAVHGRALAAQGLRQALAGGSVSEIFAWSERSRAQALLLPPVHPPEDPAVAALVEELRGVHTSLVAREAAGRAAGALRVRRDAIQRRLREHAWSTSGPGTAARRVGLGRVRAELGVSGPGVGGGSGGAAMVVYLTDGARRGRLRALVITGTRSRLVDLGPLAPTVESLQRLRADLDVSAGRLLPTRIAASVQDATRRDAAALSARLLEPLLGLVGDRELVVVPTGGLVTVPWSVLAPTRGRAVSVAPSATSWVAARGRRVGPLTRDTRLLLVAGPRIERGGDEVTSLARHSDRPQVLDGPAATAAATLAALGDVDVAHLAAHGHHDTDNALFSGIELADGPLMGYDVQRLARPPALMVLSACDVGLHDVRPGDESIGLATALLSAGSSTVVASVCRIADEAAPAVMEAFYATLAAGSSPATALAAASADNTGFVCFGAG